MNPTLTRAVLAGVAAAPITFVMFNALEPTPRLAVSVILAITAGVFTALFFGPSSE